MPLRILSLKDSNVFRLGVDHEKPHTGHANPSSMRFASPWRVSPHGYLIFVTRSSFSSGR